jgi:serine/threonine protein kinase
MSDLDYKNKYLKYKQKYLNLKKMIGGGIDASYKINGIILTLTYYVDRVITGEIKYEIMETLGEGTSGVVSLIKKIDTEDKNLYIFKKGKVPKRENAYNEGIKSGCLKNILDDDMLVLFQGKEDSDFLISTYNGNDLLKEFRLQKQKIKEQYANVTTQLLDLLHKINSNNFFHNDIKLENITFNGKKVYLIDFGLLSKCKSSIGSLITYSYNGVIARLKNISYNKYFDTYTTLQTFLKDTDMVGFFYCCIDLLGLIEHNFDSINILWDLCNFQENDNNNLYKLFELFYFILPTPRRTIDKLNSASEYYDKKLKEIKNAESIFGSFPNEHANLFRFMTNIFYIINQNLIDTQMQQKWYIDFLKIMSACFLPDFNYSQFMNEFKIIVSQFPPALDYISPSLSPLSQPLPLPPLSSSKSLSISDDDDLYN